MAGPIMQVIKTTTPDGGIGLIFQLVCRLTKKYHTFISIVAEAALDKADIQRFWQSACMFLLAFI